MSTRPHRNNLKKYYIISAFILFCAVSALSAKSQVDNYYDLSQHLLKKKKYQQAITNALLAEKTESKNPKYTFNVGEIYYRCYHQGAFVDKQHYMPLAVDAFNRAIKKGYNKAEALHWSGRCFYQINKFAKSESYFFKVIDALKEEKKKFKRKKDKRSARITGHKIADAYIWLSKIYEYTGEFTKNDKVINAAKALHPKNRWLPGKFKKSWRIKGHLALAKADYSKAMSFYKKAEDPFWQNVCEKRRALGRIKADYTHIILVIYLQSIMRIRPNGEKVLEPATSETMIAKCRMWQGALKAWAEVHSRGKWSLAFKELKVDSVYKEGSSIKAHNTDSLNGSEAIYKMYNEIDTYAVISPAVSPGYGGLGKYPFVPEVYKGRTRGWFQVNCTYHGFNMWQHEFFHVIEQMAKIRPFHGFRKENRKKFSGWKGKTESEYYEWHFHTTLTKLGWKNLNFRKFGPLKPIDNATLKYLIGYYKNLSMKNKLLARDLCKEANQYRLKKNWRKAVPMYYSAFAYSPYNHEALTRLVEYFSGQNKKYSRCFSLYKRMLITMNDPKTEALKLRAGVPKNEDPQKAGLNITVESIYGRAFGMWIPGYMYKYGTDYEWELKEELDGPGEYKVTFWYTKGWKAVNIKYAALCANGKEISRDSHIGFSGNKKKNISYKLKLAKFDIKAKYSVKAELAGSGGTDSMGVVFIKKLK